MVVASLLVLGLNAWVDYRLPALLQEQSVGMYHELIRRIDALPAPERVRLLVFGNSHAVAGLRPPQLAAAMGLPGDAIFSLALPSCSPRELGQFVEQLAPRFPGAQLAITNLDPSLLIATRLSVPRFRYLTRFAPLERWHYARESVDDDPGRLALMLTAPLRPGRVLRHRPQHA